MQNSDTNMPKELEGMIEYTREDLEYFLNMKNSKKPFWKEFGHLLSKAAIITMITTSSLIMTDYIIGKAFQRQKQRQKQRQTSLEQVIEKGKKLEKPKVYFTTQNDETFSDISRATGWPISKLKEKNYWMTRVDPRNLNLKPGLEIKLPQDSPKKNMNRFLEFISNKENYALILSRGKTLNFERESQKLIQNYKLAKSNLKRNNLIPIIKKAAKFYDLEPELIEALIITESGGNSSTRDSKDGAIGLGQIMPQEFRSLITLNNIYRKKHDPRYNPRIPTKFKNKYRSQLKNPELNIYLTAMSYQKNLEAITKTYPELSRKEQKILAIAAFNGGLGIIYDNNGIKGFEKDVFSLYIDAIYLYKGSIKETVTYLAKTLFYLKLAKNSNAK